MTEQLPADVTVIKHQKFADHRGYLNCLFETERQETFDGYSLKMSSPEMRAPVLVSPHSIRGWSPDSKEIFFPIFREQVFPVL